MNFFYLLYFIISSVYANTNDEILNEKIKKFQETQDASEIESLSADVFFIGNGHLISGNSGKALIYFKSALQMTPKHAITINKKIIESINVFKDVTLKIPPENCEEITSRTNFIKDLSPDSYHEIVQAFPKCLNISTIKEDLNEKANQIKIDNDNIATQKEIIEKEKQKIDEFNKTKFSFLNLNLPEQKKEQEQNAFNSLGEEISTVLKNREFLPDDMISTMQDEALKLIKLESLKPKLDYSSIDDNSSVIQIPIKFSYLNNQIIKNEFTERYKQLLELKGAERIFLLDQTTIKVTPIVAQYLRKNRFLDQKPRFSSAESFFPIFPSFIVLKIELSFKDNTKNFDIFMPSMLANFNNSFTPFFSFNVKHWNNEIINQRSGRPITLENQEYIIEQKVKNSLLKDLVDVKVSLDKDATIVLNNIFRNEEISSPELLSFEITKDENGDIHSGISYNQKKEGLFYVYRNNKSIGTIVYRNDQPLSANIEVVDKKQEGVIRYCADMLCHIYLDLIKKENNYKFTLSIGSAACAIGDSNGLLVSDNSNKWKATDENGQKLEMRFEKNEPDNAVLFLNIKETCLNMLGEHKLTKK